jgi:hypothetical protein
MVYSGKWEHVLCAIFGYVEVDTQPFLYDVGFGNHAGVGYRCWVKNLSDDYHILNFLTSAEKIFLLLRLAVHIRLHGICTRAHLLAVFGHLPRYPGKIRGLLGEHISVILEKDDEQTFRLDGHVGPYDHRALPVLK